MRTPRSTKTQALVLALLLIGCGSAAGEERQQWQPPDEIMDALGITAGMRIGEAGAGEGYLTFPLARRVGPNGKVYANEIDAGDLEVIRRRAEAEQIDTIETVLGEVEDPRFPERDLDLIIMVYVLHHLERPQPFLVNLKSYLRAGAPLVIIERNTTKSREHHDHHSFMGRSQVLSTVRSAGYRLVRTHTFLPKDTIYVFEGVPSA